MLLRSRLSMVMLVPVRPSFRRAASSLVLAFLCAATAKAQADTTKSGRHRIWPVATVRAGTPAVASIGVGALYATTSEFRGPFISVEPGVRAGRASAGYSMIKGNLAAGPVVRASFMRRYAGKTIGNYAGLEAQFVAALVGPRIGVFRSLHGASYLLTLDFGVGF